jgi:hypothetical protein
MMKLPVALLGYDTFERHRLAAKLVANDSKCFSR